jgi:hypothetical protein
MIAHYRTSSSDVPLVSNCNPKQLSLSYAVFLVFQYLYHRYQRGWNRDTGQPIRTVTKLSAEMSLVLERLHPHRGVDGDIHRIQ